ncbi:hypothetical protein C0J52_13324 [Blattella germanica]|nr:hypothetical protein C0J52_13324 [Blattella germanica]
MKILWFSDFQILLFFTYKHLLELIQRSKCKIGQILVNNNLKHLMRPIIVQVVEKSTLGKQVSKDTYALSVARNLICNVHTAPM